MGKILMDNCEIHHIKHDLCFFIYNCYIRGLDTSQIYHSIELFYDENINLKFDEINDIIDYYNSIL